MKSSARTHFVSILLTIAVFWAVAFSSACSSAAQSSVGTAKPEIHFSRIPPRGGGPDKLDSLAGSVTGIDIGACDCRMVIFSETDQLYVQPWADAAYTKVLADGTFKAEIHLGYRYHAVLVKNSYRAQATLNEAPRVGGDVLQVASVEAGAESEKQTMRTIRFSGREWKVKASARQTVGPGPNVFSDSRENVWVDANDRLHLRITHRSNKWECAEVILAEEHAYGTYSFTLDTPPSVVARALNGVLGAFVWNDADADHNHDEVDFELSPWSRPGNKLGQFVIQPYVDPHNIVRFDMAEALAPTTHVFTWRPDRVECASFNGSGTKESMLVYRHIFTQGIPPDTPGTNARINLWLIGGKAPADNRELEIVISRFEFKPFLDS